MCKVFFFCCKKNDKIVVRGKNHLILFHCEKYIFLMLQFIVELYLSFYNDSFQQLFNLKLILNITSNKIVPYVYQFFSFTCLVNISSYETNIGTINYYRF